MTIGFHEHCRGNYYNEKSCNKKPMVEQLCIHIYAVFSFHELNITKFSKLKYCYPVY